MRPVGEDLQDDLLPVDDRHTGKLLPVALLRRRERLVEDDHVGLLRLGEGDEFYVRNLARAVTNIGNFDRATELLALGCVLRGHVERTLGEPDGLRAAIESPLGPLFGDGVRLRDLTPGDRDAPPAQRAGIDDVAISPDGATLYVGNSGGESISIIDLDRLRVTGRIRFPAIPFNGATAVISPSILAVTQNGLQIMMSNGTLWRVIGDEAIPRRVSPVIGTATIPAPRTMVATPNGEYMLLLAGNVMEPSSIVLITAPILFPVAVKLGIHPVHLGILMTVNMEVGLCHPPVGLNLYVASGIAKMGIPPMKVIQSATLWPAARSSTPRRA